MLISPPSWVKRDDRLSAAATQSMFSVPEVIETRAPEDSANHSSGTRMRSARSSAAITRRHSGSDSAPSDLVGFAEQHHAGHALGVAYGGRGDDAGDDRRGVPAPGAVHRYERARLVEVVLDETAVRAGEHAVSSYG